MIPWDQAQFSFLGLSRKFGDAVQGLLAQRFKGSPNTAQTAAVRQLRTTAAPAIAVEISSVTVEKREDLDRMASGVADAIARGASSRSSRPTSCPWRLHWGRRRPWLPLETPPPNGIP